MYDEFLNFIFFFFFRSQRGPGRYNSPIFGATIWG